VTVQCQFKLVGSWDSIYSDFYIDTYGAGGSTVFTVFTGYVSMVQFSASGSAVVTVSDSASLMSGSLTLPAASAIPAGSNYNIALTGDVTFSPLVVVDQALRAGGIYLTPPPNVYGMDRAAMTYLSVSGCGGYLPNVGVRSLPGVQGRREVDPGCGVGQGDAVQSDEPDHRREVRFP